jgi:Zn-dependent peptidase ImmA (M78 family)
MWESLSSVEYLILKRLGNPDQYLTKTGFSKGVAKLKEVLRKDVHKILVDNGLINPPIRIEKINRIDIAKIRIEYANMNEGEQGLLIPDERGFIIKVNRMLKRLKARTVIAHELSHTFFYDIKELPPRKYGTFPSLPGTKTYWIEEDVCRFLAREFLMPTFSMKGLRQLFDVSIENLISLRRAFEVTYNTLLFRLIKDLELWESIAIIYNRKNNLFMKELAIKGKGYKRVIIPSHIIIPSDTSSHPTFYARHKEARRKSNELLCNVIANSLIKATSDRTIKENIRISGRPHVIEVRKLSPKGERFLVLIHPREYAKSPLEISL